MFTMRHLVLISSLLILAACGGSSGGDVLPGDGGGAGNNPAIPLASIVFPPMNALTTEGEIIVRGTASLPGGTVTEVWVNGFLADTGNGFATWRAQVRLAPGANTITASVIGSNGESDLSADSVQIERQGPLIEAGVGIGLDASGDLIVADRENGVLRVRLTDEEREAVSNDTSGSGPAFNGAVQKMDVVPAANMAYVGTGRDLYAVDLSNGARSEIVLTGTTTPSFIDAIGVDPSGTFAIVASNSDVYRVELATGATSLASATTVGYSRPEGILVFATSAFVHFHNVIERIDLVTGVRTVISNVSTGSGPSFSPFYYDVARDPTQPGRLLSLANNAILAVDVATGDRTTLSGNGVGQGPDLFRGEALVPVAGGVYVVMDHGLMYVDLITGDRRRVSPARIGSGPLPTNDSEPDLAVDPTTGLVLLADDGWSDVVLVDPQTGVRTAIPGTDVVENVTFDPNGGVAYFLNWLDGGVHSLNVQTGAMAEVSGATRGAGPAFDSLYDLSPGPQPGTLVVNDTGLGVVLVDIATGDRSILTPAGNFTSPEFDDPFGVTADPLTGMVFIADESLDGVVEIDSGTGGHATIVDLQSLFGIDVYDAAYMSFDNSVYVGGTFDVVRVTPGTGAAVEVSSDVEGIGPPIAGMYNIDAASDTGIVYVFDWDDKLVALDVTTGTRVVIAR